MPAEVGFPPKLDHLLLSAIRGYLCIFTRRRLEQRWNSTLVPFAASTAEGEIVLHQGKDDDRGLGSTILKGWWAHNSHKHKVRAIDLANWFNNAIGPDKVVLLSVDVEVLKDLIQR